MFMKKKKKKKKEKQNENNQPKPKKKDSNSKTLILKDSSVRSIWIYLTASPCYTANTNNKHDNTTNKYYKHD